MQRLGNFTEVTDESAVKVNKAEEGLQSLLGSGNLPLLDGSNLFRVGTNLSIPYDQTKVLDFWFLEEAFFRLQTEVMIT